MYIFITICKLYYYMIWNNKSYKENILKKVQENWSKHLNNGTTFETVTKGFKNIKTIAPSVYLHFNNFKLLHRRTVYNKLLFTMGISETPNFQTERETIEHICIECDNVTEDWVRMIYDAHFKTSDIEKIFGENNNIPVKQ